MVLRLYTAGCNWSNKCAHLFKLLKIIYNNHSNIFEKILGYIFPILALIQGSSSATLPKKFAPFWPQKFQFQLGNPMTIAVSSDSLLGTTKGPPESPAQIPFPTFPIKKTLILWLNYLKIIIIVIPLKEANSITAPVVILVQELPWTLSE